MPSPHFTLEETKIAVVILQALSDKQSSTSRPYIDADNVNRLLGIDESDTKSQKIGIQAANDVLMKLELTEAIVAVRGPRGEAGTSHISTNTITDKGKVMLKQMIERIADAESF